MMSEYSEEGPPELLVTVHSTLSCTSSVSVMGRDRLPESVTGGGGGGGGSRDGNRGGSRAGSRGACVAALSAFALIAEV